MVIEDAIRRAKTDEALFKVLSSELARRLRSSGRRGAPVSVAQHAAKVARLPTGLRAMASIYELDVSVTLDDLGFHFGNWHSKTYAHETERGLRVLGAQEPADIFARAFRVAAQYWAAFTRDDFVEWYYKSTLERRLRPLNLKIWQIHQSREHGLLTYWLDYARRHPERVAGAVRSSNKRMQLTRRGAL